VKKSKYNVNDYYRINVVTISISSSWLMAVNHEAKTLMLWPIINDGEKYRNTINVWRPMAKANRWQYAAVPL